MTVQRDNEYGPWNVHAVERPALSVVATTEDQSFVDELERVLSREAELIIVATCKRHAEQARTVEVFPLESSYRRNRGLLLARAPVVVFLEEGQLPAQEWPGAVASAFAVDARPAAAIGDGNVAYDRSRLLAAHGFPLFTGAPPGSPVPDILALRRLRSEGQLVTNAPRMTLARRGPGGAPDARRVGRALRLNREVRPLARAARNAVRGRAVGDLVDLAAGALVDRDWPFEPPAVGRLPPAISEAVGARELVPLPAGQKGKLHFLYRADELVVHLYVGPTGHLRDAVAARKAISERSRAPGIPRLHASEESVDALWLVEDFVTGVPIDRERLREPDPVARWIVTLGGPPGPPLVAAQGWRMHARHLLEAGFPDDVAQRLKRSLEAVQQVPARHLHGDLNPRNVLVDGNRLAAVDWENASLEFIPGLDLVFLFLLADGRPNERVIIEPGRLVSYLHELALDSELIPHALRVMLATWGLGERNRRTRLGVDPGPAVFEPLFLGCERLLR